MTTGLDSSSRPAITGVVEADWASATFTMNWKITRAHTPVRFEVDEPICVILPQRRGELEAFQPKMRSIGSDKELQRRYRWWNARRGDYLVNCARDLSTIIIPAGSGTISRGHTRGRARWEHASTRLHLLPFG